MTRMADATGSGTATGALTPSEVGSRPVVSCRFCLSPAVVYENDAPYCGPCWTKRNAWIWNLR